MNDKHDEMARELLINWYGRSQPDVSVMAVASALRQVERETLEHTTYLRPEVFAFAERMERKLRENDHKGGWKGCGPVYLMRRLREETGELDRAMCGSYGIDAERVGDEAADVANFAMMIADNAGVLSPTQSADVVPEGSQATIYLTPPMLREAIEFFTPDKTADDDEIEIAIGYRSHVIDDDGNDTGRHLCMWFADYPDEGVTPLDGKGYEFAANELSTTQELADVSTPVKLIDRDQAIIATSIEVDFEKGTWTFEPKGQWSVSAGDYYLISIQAAEKGE